MPDEPKTTKQGSSLPKMVEVRVISKNAGAALVEYYEKASGSHRVIIPGELVQEGKAPLEELEAGAPYGIDWTAVKVKPFSAVELERALHDEGIWTKEDLLQKRVVVLTTINRISGLLLSDLLLQIK